MRSLTEPLIQNYGAISVMAADSVNVNGYIVGLCDCNQPKMNIMFKLTVLLVQSLCKEKPSLRNIYLIL